LSIPADYRRKLRQELYYCRKFGIREHLQKIGLDIPEDAYRMQLLGKINYVLQLYPDDRDMIAAKNQIIAKSR
ncbi:MAG: RNA-directed DNA polymerase, partial [Oscillospiraceae bacterium]|nr:RNA-directed DNA polymerase [Oscillospiraceae bacterium]